MSHPFQRQATRLPLNRIVLRLLSLAFAFAVLIVLGVTVTGRIMRSLPQPTPPPLRQAREPTSSTAPTILAIGQGPDYFRAKWGLPIKANKDGAQMEWSQGNLKALVTFADGQAQIIRYTLATNQWTQAQITAALAANGSDWKPITYGKDGGVLNALGSAVLASGGIMRWRSSEGHQADILGPIMTVKSAKQVHDEADKRAAEARARQAVPNF